ncbi:MAG: molybdopterin molybdotransferase MoeA [Gemmatimonadetes bacterium]|nr:molybdopterin molybdotransferase MoeA [Gemmatimonadota bacterium]
MKLSAPPPIPFDEAKRLVRAEVAPLAIERVPLGDAWGRVLAAPVIARDPVPPFAGSMVDGFAVRAADVAAASAEHPVPLVCRLTIAAGEDSAAGPGPGEAIRIMTGAPAPRDADAIVMLEDTEWDADRVLVRRAVPVGAHLRRVGEDVERGATVLAPGRALRPADVGACAAAGFATVDVHARPRVAILVTGDELLPPAAPLTPGKIRSSNDWTLAAQVREAGALPEVLGVGADSEADLESALERARDVDVLVTSGGVSVGDRDLVRAVLAATGFEERFWRVASSPGKPLLFGRRGRTLVFGLPGNPVSSAVAFENFVRPTLRAQQGDLQPERPVLRARVEAEITGPVDRRHFARVAVRFDGAGPVVREVGPRGSGNLTSLVHADGLAILPEGVGRVGAADAVDVMWLAGGR